MLASCDLGPQNLEYYFHAAVTWTALTIGSFSARLVPVGFIYADKGPLLSASDPNLLPLLAGLLNGRSSRILAEAAGPDSGLQPGAVLMPFRTLAG